MERPILFNGDMVRAILEGRKTQTRRAVKTRIVTDDTAQWSFCVDSTNRKSVNMWTCAVLDENGKRYTSRGRERVVVNLKCPYGQAGDKLWVREAWTIDNTTQDENGVCPSIYRTDLEAGGYDRSWTWQGGRRWTPSIHMPRWASRITLEITDVRVQRLQDISEEDAIAEGMQKSIGGIWCGSLHKAHGFPRQHNTAVEAFADIWDSIYAKRGYTWAANPWVWAIGFQRA